jgi:hypothetical protein
MPMGNTGPAFCVPKAPDWTKTCSDIVWGRIHEQERADAVRREKEASHHVKPLLEIVRRHQDPAVLSQYSPEAARFTARRLRKLADTLEELGQSG